MSVTGWGCDVAIVIGNNSRRNTYMFPSVCGLNPFAKISNISLLCKFLGFFCQKWLTDHRILDGCFLVARAQEIFRRIFNYNPCVPCVPWIFWGLLRKKSLGEIFNEIWPLARNKSSDLRRSLCGNKIFK